jgi:cysteinyl-tRNA synthetase
MEDARRAVARVREAVRRLGPDAPPAPELDALAERFFDELADDFNTPAARTVLFEWVGEANRRLDRGEPLGAGRLGEMLHALGLESLLAPQHEDAPEEVERMAAERDAARSARDFERADRLRDEVARRGWEIRDTADGARLVRRA